MKLVFEVSWEVCNKVGGIHTVITTKAAESVANYGDSYIAIGPDLGQEGSEFIESVDEFFETIAPALEHANIPCRFGFWNIPGKPRVILVGGFKERFNIERLLHAYWEEFGVDSYEGSWDYVEPILFSTTCGEVIEHIVKATSSEEHQPVAHFHEWMSGAGVLYLRKNMPAVGTVLTTHATMLGRSMAHHNSKYYNEIESAQSFKEHAHIHGVQSKHSMEAISAKNADCFTTVSEITAREAYKVLGVDPDLVVYNGMNVKQKLSIDERKNKDKKNYLLKICSSFLGETLPENTQIWVSSGRYEFKNKGYDITLDALSKLREKLQDDCPPILMLFLVAADNQKLSNYAIPRSTDENYREVAISPVYNKDHDHIINATKHYGLDEKKSPIKVVFSSLYLDGNDGIFNLSYEEILKVCDLSLFPSFYEPWGYTPLESAINGIPTITSDLAGFGYWTQVGEDDWSHLIKVLNRKNKSFEDASYELTALMEDYCLNPKNKTHSLEQANKLREKIDWSMIYGGYKTAYDIASSKAYERLLLHKGLSVRNPFTSSRCHIQPGRPALRCMAIEPHLPSVLAQLNEIAYNIWWSWNPQAQELFQSLNPELWEYFEHNPVKLLKSIPAAEFEELAKDPVFMSKLDDVYQNFKNYMGEICLNSIIDPNRPIIAYLSMEFGLHESLPIYSGGLGILAGDHLKAASDMNQNLIGIGLFYKNGYFVQEINSDGYQVEHYPQHDWKNMPISILLNQTGEPVKIPVEYPDRIVWTRVLLIRVGRVPLFLFDTDIEDNNPKDREISSRLYIGDRQARIEQEILIGIASVRLAKDVLGLDPAVYHLNEGHCAFMSAELIRRYMLQGYSFESAVEAIQGHTVFTTHTPVPAGNEAFAVDLVHKMLNRFFEHMHVSIHKFLDLGRNIGNREEFSMTVLALKVSRKANAVSKLHGDVSVEMWKPVMRNEERFFGYVTNGVHMPTWLAPGIRSLCDEGEIINFEKIRSCSDDVVWQKHQEDKKSLIKFLKERIKKEYLRKGMDIQKVKQILANLNENTLLVGFARRFAEYKRASLLFKDPERLLKIIDNSDQPIVFVFAGKSHPADTRCKELIQELYRYALEDKYIGKILILENYNIYMAKLLTSGTDVWLNNPIMRKEACGTSGMKAAASGSLNLSLPDGWWLEGYKPELGWKIEPSQAEDFQDMCREESESLYSLLENEIIPLYYQRENGVYSNQWVEKMKNSIADIGVNFSARRMVEDYSMKMYFPVIKRSVLTASN